MLIWVFMKMNNILLKFALKVGLLDGPKYLGLGLTLNCNFKCLFCLRHSPLEYEPHSSHYKTRPSGEDGRALPVMDIGLFRRVCDDAHRLGIRSVNLSGNGETLLHPGFIEMCGYLKAKRFYCGMSTNGALLREETLERLADMGFDHLNISLNAASPATHKQIHYIDKDVFPSILENLRHISSYKMKTRKTRPLLSLSFVICKINYSEIMKMIEIGVNVGARQVSFGNLLYCKAREGLMGPLLLEPEDIISLKKEMAPALPLANRHHLITNIPSFLKKLQSPKDHIFSVQKKDIYTCQIQADGTMYPYDFPYRMGNIKDSSLIQIWYSQKYVDFRKRLLCMAERKEKLPNLPFCERCDAPLREPSLCAIQC